MTKEEQQKAFNQKLEEQGRTQLIPIADIDDNPANNCRGVINFADVKFLADAIKNEGLLQPIVVKPNGDGKYTLIAGFSRTMAVKSLGWKSISAIIRTDVDHAQALVLNLSENVNRRQLNILQEAEAVRRLFLAFPGINAVDLGAKLGQSRGWVNTRQWVLELPPELHPLLAKGAVTTAQIQQLKAMETLEDRYVAIKKLKEADERGIKVDLTNMLINRRRNQGETADVRTRKQIFLMQSHIMETIGPGFAARSLAWAAGEISSLDLLHDLKGLAEAEGKVYDVDIRNVVERKDA